MTNISIIIPTHNRVDKLLRLIESLYQSKLDQIELQIIVVNNASTDDTIGRLKQYKDIILINEDQNLYSAQARDIGLSKATGEYIAFIDDDNILEKNCLEELVKHFKTNGDMWVVAPIMYYFDRKNVVWCAGGLMSKYGVATHRYSDEFEPNLAKGYINADYFPNFYMTSKKAVDLGLRHDPSRFPHNYAEQDYCFRAKKMGIKLAAVSAAKDWHDVGYRRKITRLNVANVYDQARSRNVFRKIYYNNLMNRIFFICVLFPVSTVYYLKTFYSVKSAKPNQFVGAYFRGFLDGALGK